MATIVEGDPKAPFSIATTPKCKAGCYSFPWISLLYPWSVPWCWVLGKEASSIIFESLVWLDQEIETKSPGPLANTRTILPMSGKIKILEHIYALINIIFSYKKIHGKFCFSTYFSLKLKKKNFLSLQILCFIQSCDTLFRNNTLFQKYLIWMLT